MFLFSWCENKVVGQSCQGFGGYTTSDLFGVYFLKEGVQKFTLGHLWLNYVPIKKCIYKIVLCLLLLCHSLIHWFNGYPATTEHLPCARCLIHFLSLSFLSFLWLFSFLSGLEDKLNEKFLTSEYFIPILSLFSLLLSTSCSAALICVHILLFVVLGSLSTVFLVQNYFFQCSISLWLPATEMLLCCCLEETSCFFRHASVRLLIQKLLKF